MSSSKLMSSFRQAQSSVKTSKNAPQAPHIQNYVTGLRGVLVIQSLLWIYLQTFAPAMVYPSSVYETDGPTWQYVFRDVFCAPFWNGSLIYSFFIILSARTVCIPFLSNPCGAVYAGALVRRNIRVGLSISVATALSLIIFSSIEHGYFAEFNSILKGSVVTAPALPQKPYAGFLAIYDLLWISRSWYTQAANMFWPSSTMWVPSLIYFQSYTVYIAMVILPFTRASWHIQGCFLFALGSFWLETWGWYSITGLMLADISINPALRAKLQKGMQITEHFSLPYFIPAVAFIILGFVQKYLWIAAFPSQLDRELILHPTIWTADDLSVSDFTSQPYARLDNWMVIVGSMVLIERFEPLQKALSIKPLTYLGDRSLSIFTAQCLIAYSLGIKMFISLVQTHNLTTSGAGAAVFFSCVPLSLIFAEVYHRAVDAPSRWLAKQFYIFITE